jgi:hypothetical protein
VSQTLPFLRAAQPGALRPLIENGFTTVDMAAVQAFAQKTLVPMVRISCSSHQQLKQFAVASVHVIAEAPLLNCVTWSTSSDQRKQWQEQQQCGSKVYMWPQACVKQHTQSA